MILSII